MPEISTFHRYHFSGGGQRESKDLRELRSTQLKDGLLSLTEYYNSREAMLMLQVENSDQVAAANPWLSEDLFSTACAALPLVSIDFMVTRPSERGREILLGLRNNRPAQDWWFTPGGRIRKNEPLASAMQRVARDEIGMNPEWLDRAKLMGAWDHFYPDSAFDADISTHYVNLPYTVHLSANEAQTLKLPIGYGSQHMEWQWILIVDAQNNRRVHNYVQAALACLLEV